MKTKLLLKSMRQIHKSYFSINDVSNFYHGQINGLPVILNRLVKRGDLFRVSQGYYTYDLSKVDYEDLACTIKKPSYISLEYALYHHGLIDQIPQSITLITTGKSATLSCAGKFLEYSHIKKDLYFGFEIYKNALIAYKEKAILDEIYLISLGKRSLNISPEWFQNLDKKLLKTYLTKFPPRVRMMVKNLLLQSKAGF